MSFRSGLLAVLMISVLLFAGLGLAQPASQEPPDITKVPAAAQPSDHFDVDTATNAYMDLMPAAAKAHGDAYFEGGYWLILWDFLVGVDAQSGGTHRAL